MTNTRRQFEEAFSQHNIEVAPYYLSRQAHALLGLSKYIGKTDAIVTLRDTTAYLHMSEIIAFCNRHKITLLSSDLSSVTAGAALGF